MVPQDPDRLLLSGVASDAGADARPEARGMKMSELNTIADAMALVPHGPGRRKEERKRLIYRLVQIAHEGDQGLARCRNISESGLKLELTMNVTLDARMTVAFSDAHVFAGTVI